MGSKERILKLFLERAGTVVPRQEVIDAAGASEWARRIRDLRQDGWQIEPTKDGYRLKSKTKRAGKDSRAISQKLRYKLMQAANGACPSCGEKVADGARLVIDHKIPLEWGGKTDEDNLWAICTTCNQGKRDFYSDENAEKMRAVLAMDSAKARILQYFRLSVGKKVNKDQLMMVARISEWARRVRDLRAAGWNIVSHNEDSTLRPGEYILRSDKLRRS